MSALLTKTAPHGSWKSPITSDLIVAQSITLSELCLDGGHVYWLEGRPQEQGRYVVVRADADGRPTDITRRISETVSEHQNLLPFGHSSTEIPVSVRVFTTRPEDRRIFTIGQDE
jgi:hypothetical protein